MGAFDAIRLGHFSTGLVLNKGDNQEANRSVFLAPDWSPSLLSSSEIGFENKTRGFIFRVLNPAM